MEKHNLIKGNIRENILFYTFLITFFACSGVRQLPLEETIEVDKELNKLAKQLLEKGSEVITYQVGCSGCIEGSYNSGYLIYNDERENINAIKVDIYKCYPAVRLTSGYILDYYKKHSNEIVDDYNLKKVEPKLSHYDFEKLSYFNKNAVQEFIIYENDDPCNYSALVDWLRIVTNEVFLLESNPQYW